MSPGWEHVMLANSSKIRAVKNYISITWSLEAQVNNDHLLANRVPVEMMLLLAEVRARTLNVETVTDKASNTS